MKQNKTLHNKKSIVNSKKSKSSGFNNSIKEVFYVGFMLLLTVIIYSNSITNSLLSWDDATYITDNPYLKNLSFSNIKAIFTGFYFSNYHPLTTLSWVIESNIFKGVQHYHIINLILHLLNVLLVYIFVKKIIKRMDIAVIVSLLFAIHPMHAESVAWISERKDLLYAFFFLLSLVVYVKYINEKYLFRNITISFILFLCSLLSKSMAVTLPLVLLLIDYYSGRKFDKKLIIEKIPFFILSIIIGIVAIRSQIAADQNLYIPVFNILDRIFLVTYAMCFYIFKVIMPINLSALHPYPEKIGKFLPFIYYLSAIALLIICWGIYKLKVLKKEIVFGLLFFLVSISVVIQLIPIGQANVAERYTYIPYLGLFFIIGMLYKYLNDNVFSFEKIKKSVIYGVMFIAIVLFSYQTYNRNIVWKNTKNLFSDVIKKYPKNYYGYFGLANAYFDEGDYEKALSLYNTALKYNKQDKVTYNNLGYIKVKLKDPKGAIQDFDKALQLDPNYISPYINRGNLKIDLQDYTGAIKDFDMVMKLNPENWLIYYNRALAKSNILDFKGAIEDYTKSMEYKSNFSMNYNNRAMAKNAIQDYKGALEDYNKALEIEPNNPQIMLNRGITKMSIQDYQGALMDFSKTISINPNNYDAFLNRGNAKLSLNQFAEAILDYKNALVLNPNYAAAYFNIGMCNIQLQKTSEACQNFKKALDLGAIQANDMIKQYCK